MDRIVVRGGARLSGEVAVSGSKNSTLALMAAALLADGETVLRRVPRLRDWDAMLELTAARATRSAPDWIRGRETRADRPHAASPTWSRLRHRAQDSELVPGAGPACSREFGSARVSEPGGCAIACGR